MSFWVGTTIFIHFYNMDLLYIDGGESQSPACSEDIQKTRIQYIGMINTKQPDTFYSYISHLFQLVMVSLKTNWQWNFPIFLLKVSFLPTWTCWRKSPTISRALVLHILKSQGWRWVGGLLPTAGGFTAVFFCMGHSNPCIGQPQ